MLCALRIAHIVLVLALIIRVSASEGSKSICRQRLTQPSQMGQRCVTDTEVYVNKTGVQHQHHCTLLCIKDPTCQVMNFNIAGRYCELGRGLCVTLEREVDSVTTFMSMDPCLKWVPNLNNDVYKAISFGKFIGSSDSIFVTRARMGKNKIPGKSVFSLTNAYYSWGGREKWLPKSESEYLTLSPECTINWIARNSSSGNTLPTGAVIGGNLADLPLYVARKYAVHKPNRPIEYSSGYYDNVNRLGHFPYGGMDIVYNEVEVLVVQR